MVRKRDRRHLAVVTLVVAFIVGGVTTASSSGARESRADQARQAVTGFIKAYNRHDARAALTYFTSDPRFTKNVSASDCDFGRGLTVAYSGKAEVARWLRERAADHDRFTIAKIRLVGTKPKGAVVTYSRRFSDTLASRGHSTGIAPSSGTKIGFTTAGPMRLTQFANAGATNWPCEP